MCYHEFQDMDRSDIRKEKKEVQMEQKKKQSGSGITSFAYVFFPLPGMKYPARNPERSIIRKQRTMRHRAGDTSYF